MAINHIQSLYKIEKKAKLLTSEKRQQLRIKEAEQILDKFHEWLTKSAKTVTPKSKIGVAVSYTLNQWEKLRRYLYSGELGIDNNVTERDEFKIQKNQLYAGFRIWRRNPESNRDTRICNPMHSHSAIPPYIYFKLVPEARIELARLLSEGF